MTTTSKVVGLLSVTLLAVVVAVLLGSRSGSAPAAAQASAGSALNNPAEPAVARLGELQLSRAEFQAVLDSLPAQGREQLRNDRPALEGWLRARLAEKALLQQAQAQGWAERPEIQRLTRTAQEQIVAVDHPGARGLPLTSRTAKCL